MARVYLFNLIDGDRYGPRVRILVNGCTAFPYDIPNTYPSINYVPFSTSGTIVGGVQPQGNNFIDSNQLLAKDASGDLSNLFDGVATPDGSGDLITFISGRDIALYDQSGVFHAAYLASPTMAAPESASADLAADHAEDIRTVPGTVYIFNIFSQAVDVSSNGGAIGQVPAWSDGSGQVPIYTPSVLLARRVLNQSDAPGNIANGPNWIETRSLQRPSAFSFTIDGNAFPMNQSLMLFISWDHWRLTTQFGVVVDEGELTVRGGAESSSENQPEGGCDGRD